MNDRKYLVLPALLSIILLGGCATYPTPYGGGGYGFNPNAVTGAVTGAAIGTVAGAVAGDPGAGAAIGGVVGHCRDLGQGRIRLRHFMHHPRTTVLHPSTMVHLHRCITIPIIHATTVTAVGNIGSHPSHARARGDQAYPTPQRRSDLSPGIGRQHSLSDTTIPSARSERVDAGPLGRGAKLGARKFDLRGVRANLLAGVTPSEAVIVDAAAARGVQMVRL